MTTTYATDVEFRVNCKPFSDFPRGQYRVLVEACGDIRVYDSVAGYFTSCHSLSVRSAARIRTIAKTHRQ